MNGGAGSISNLQLRNVPSQPPQPHEVSIKVRAIGLNFADVFAILGLYSATPKGEFVPGLEIAGVVTAKGSQVPSSIKIGSRVFGCTKFGGFTERLNLDARYVRKLPEQWSFADGAAFLAQSLTAYFGLVTLGGLRKGQTVLVHSAAGGTGLFALKFAQIFGAFPIGTVSSDDKVAALTTTIEEGVGILKQPLPRAAVINRSSCDSSNLEKVIKESLGNSYTHEPLMKERKNLTLDLVFDSLLGDWFAAAWKLLEPMGRHVVLGAASMTPSGNSVNWLTLAWQYLRRPMIDPLETISLNKSFMAFNLIWLYEKYDEMSRIMDEMLNILGFENAGRFEDEGDDKESKIPRPNARKSSRSASGANNRSKDNSKNETNSESLSSPSCCPEKPVIGCIVKFDELPKAIRTFQSGRTIGKVIVEV